MTKLPESIERLNEIYREGFRARMRGERNNPYATGTVEYENWSVGWEDQNDHINTRDEAIKSLGWFG